MNKSIICGRMTRDPEVRYAEKSTVARFALAVDRKIKTNGQPDADFISCVAFGKTAEFIEKYFCKGMKMLLEGHIQTGNYTDKDGVKHYTTDVIAESVEFAESKRTDAPQETQENSGTDFVPMVTEAELPF